MSITSLLMKVALLGAEWVLWILVVLSAISISVAIEKGIYFYRRRISILNLCNRFQQILYEEGIEKAKEFLGKYEAIPQVRIVLSALAGDEKMMGKDAIMNAMIAAKNLEKIKMEKHLNFLSTLGNNAPFIGLFGTVLGIMGAFYKLHLNISGGTNVVMKDISEALVATAAGLFVAIPAVIFTNIFRQKIKKTISESTILASILFNYIESRPQNGGEN